MFNVLGVEIDVDIYNVVFIKEYSSFCILKYFIGYIFWIFDVFFDCRVFSFVYLKSRENSEENKMNSFLVICGI